MKRWIALWLVLCMLTMVLSAGGLADDATPSEPVTEVEEKRTTEPTEEAMEEPAPVPTPEPTEEATKEPAPEPTPEPMPERTEETTEEPAPEPTPGPTEEATEEPIPEPTIESTMEPTPEPTEEPAPERFSEGYAWAKKDATVYEGADCAEVLGRFTEECAIYVTAREETEVEEQDILTVCVAVENEVTTGYMFARDVRALSEEETEKYIATVTGDVPVTSGQPLRNASFVTISKMPEPSPMESEDATPEPTITPSVATFAGAMAETVNVSGLPNLLQMDEPAKISVVRLEPAENFVTGQIGVPTVIKARVESTVPVTFEPDLMPEYIGRDGREHLKKCAKLVQSADGTELTFTYTPDTPGVFPLAVYDSWTCAYYELLSLNVPDGTGTIEKTPAQATQEVYFEDLPPVTPEDTDGSWSSCNLYVDLNELLGVSLESGRIWSRFSNEGIKAYAVGPIEYGYVAHDNGVRIGAYGLELRITAPGIYTMPIYYQSNNSSEVQTTSFTLEVLSSEKETPYIDMAEEASGYYVPDIQYSTLNVSYTLSNLPENAAVEIEIIQTESAKAIFDAHQTNNLRNREILGYVYISPKAAGDTEFTLRATINGEIFEKACRLTIQTLPANAPRSLTGDVEENEVVILQDGETRQFHFAIPTGTSLEGFTATWDFSVREASGARFIYGMEPTANGESAVLSITGSKGGSAVIEVSLNYGVRLHTQFTATCADGTGNFQNALKQIPPIEIVFSEGSTYEKTIDLKQLLDSLKNMEGVFDCEHVGWGDDNRYADFRVDSETQKLYVTGNAAGTFELPMSFVNVGSTERLTGLLVIVARAEAVATPTAAPAATPTAAPTAAPTARPTAAPTATPVLKIWGSDVIIKGDTATYTLGDTNGETWADQSISWELTANNISHLKWVDKKIKKEGKTTKCDITLTDAFDLSKDTFTLKASYKGKTYKKEINLMNKTRRAIVLIANDASPNSIDEIGKVMTNELAKSYDAVEVCEMSGSGPVSEHLSEREDASEYDETFICLVAHGGIYQMYSVCPLDRTLSDGYFNCGKNNGIDSLYSYKGLFKQIDKMPGEKVVFLSACYSGSAISAAENYKNIAVITSTSFERALIETYPPCGWSCEQTLQILLDGLREGKTLSVVGLKNKIEENGEGRIRSWNDEKFLEDNGLYGYPPGTIPENIDGGEARMKLQTWAQTPRFYIPTGMEDFMVIK